MKKINFRFSLTLIIVLIISLIAACSNQPSNNEAGNSAPNNKNSNKVEDSSNPVTLDIVVNNSNRDFPEGLEPNDNPYINYVKENTGLEFNFNFPPSDAYQDTLNIIMASGDLPDLIHTYDSTWVVKYINQKALQPLNKVIDQYGSELKRLIPAEAWENVTVDGNIYAIPSVTEVKGNELMYIRKDWLDKLQLDPPQTLEEYENVMRAFVEQDPDENGQDDTLGLIIQEKLERTAPFFGAFGISVGGGGSKWNEWYKQKDNQLVNSVILPETKEALTMLANWYQEGLIDKEFALNKPANMNEKIANGKVGLFSAAWYETRGAMLTNKTNDPKAEWIAIDFPIGPEGEFGTIGLGSVQSYSVVPVTSKNAESVIKFLNFVVGEGYQNLKLGFEDEIWSMDSGQLVTNFEEHNKHLYRSTIHQMADVNTTEVRQKRLDSLGMEFKLIDNIERIEEVAIYSDFLAMPTPAMGKHGASLSMLIEETFTKMVMGTVSIEEFDNFVEAWKEQGGDEITTEVNDWYKNIQ
jgi:putative aldouronate transport system substrate-binding protein